MKKRMICVMLTLIMLMSLLPVSASAADKAISENGITVLKQLQDYKNQCVHISGNEYRIGYGTICTETGTHGAHTGYNESKADQALRAKLVELNAAVNTFAKNNKLTLNQNQFDALVVFSYDMGTAWLSGNGVLKSAVVNGTTGNAFLNAIGQSADYGGDPTDKVTGYERRMIEGNMYLTGSYSNIKPEAYGYVKYQIDRAQENMAEADANGEYIQYFDGYTTPVPQPVPTRAGYTFLGWYQQNSNGRYTWVDRLYHNQANGVVLYPKWQKYGTAWNAADSDKYTWIYSGNLSSLDIMDNPVSQNVVGTHSGEYAYVDTDFIDANGYRWSRLADGTYKGKWVLVRGTANSKPSQFDIDVNVTVTNEYVRKRANASASSKDLGRFNKGDVLRIVNTANHGGLLWGQVADEKDEAICWVALMYTNWNSVKDNAGNDNNSTKAIGSAVVSCNGYLNVRREAGTDSAIVGALANGDLVDIYQLEFVNGHKWGRTSSGWIQLTYCKVTMNNTDLDYSNDANVLAYTFTGKINTETTAHTDTSHNSDTVGKKLPVGTVVAMSMVKIGGDGDIWGFNGTGWIKLSNVNMDVAKYVVIADSVTVRDSASSGGDPVEKVTKGVELDISEIQVVDATIWGKTTKYGGWVNLASKYVTRSNAPIIENADSDNKLLSGLMATVINTDRVNVRATSSTSAKKIGTLARGTSCKVWEGSEELGWYKIDTNGNGTYDYEEDGWVSLSYLSIGYVSADNGSSSNGSNGGTAAVETGMGIIANTYSGVNIRQGAGTGYASVGKYLNGTSVEILEVTPTATSKWGRTAKGWICMDYVTMLSKYPIGNGTNTPAQPESPNPGGSSSNTSGNVTIASTPANYTGYAKQTVDILKTYDVDSQTAGAQIISQLSAGQSISIYELVKVTTKVTGTVGDVVDGNPTDTNASSALSITYWARVDGGWIQNPEDNLALNTLDETTFTVTGASDINVRDSAPNGNIITTMDKGTQAVVTRLQIVDDKVWGFVEDVATSGGWVRLDNLTQGAVTVTEPTTPPATNPSNPLNNMGNGSDTGGFVNNNTGYRYTGKVINTNAVNVRAGAGTGYQKTTELAAGASLVIYETTIAENMAWGRCDAGWVYLYYVDLVPVTGAVDARVVYNDNTIIYSDMNATTPVGTYARMSVIDIQEIVGNMAKTNQGWVSLNDLLN